MKNKILIQLTNEKAMGLLRELEELQLIKILKESTTPPKTKLSNKYRGVFTKEEALDFDRHTREMRNK